MNELLSNFEQSLDKIQKRNGNLEEQYVNLKQKINDKKLELNNLQEQLNVLKMNLKMEEETLKTLTDEKDIKTKQKSIENVKKDIEKLEIKSSKENIIYDKLKEVFTTKEQALYNKYKSIISNRSKVIEDLRTYQTQWNEWLDENVKQVDFTRLKKDVEKEKKTIEKIFEKKNILLKEKNKIQKSLLEIKNEIIKIIEEKNLYILKKMKKVERRNIEYIELQKIQEQKKLPETVDNEDERQVKHLLYENETAVKRNFDEVQYTKNLVMISNIFWRNNKIIKILDRYFKENPDKTQLITEFNKLKRGLEEITRFIDIKRFNNIIKTKYKLSDEEIKSIEIVIDYWNENKKSFFTQNMLLTNIYEYLFDKIRILLKSNSVEISEEDKLIIECKKTDGERERIYLDKSKVFESYDLEWTPLNVFKGSLKDSVEDYEITEKKGIDDIIQILNSGISITLLNMGNQNDKNLFLNGNTWNRGLLSHITEYIENMNGKIKLLDVWELYNDSIDLETGKMSSKINLNKNSKRLKTLFNKYIKNYKEQELIDKDAYNVDEWFKHRQNTFLFIHLECSFKDVKSNLVIIDFPEFQTPQQLFNQYFSERINLESLMYSNDIKYVKLYNKTNEEPEVILNKLRNAYYSNEVINHLKYYFRKLNTDQRLKINYNRGLESYSVKNFFIDPYLEYKNKIDDENNVLILPIMNYINEIISKHNKFILLSVINDNNCKETENVVEFIKNIS